MSSKCILLCVVLLFCALGSSAFGATYFVATNGSDGYPGTITQPWLTLNYAFSQVTAGDTVNVRAGTYSRVYWYQGGGAPGAYVTVQAYDGDRTVQVVEAGGTYNAFAIDGLAYIRIIGFDISGGYYCTWTNAPAHHVTFLRCYIHDSLGGDTVKGTSDPMNPASYQTVEECELARPGATAPSGNNQVIDHVNLDYGLFRNNYIHDFPDYCLVSKGGSKYVVFENNVLYNASVTMAGPAVAFGGDTGQESMAIGATFQSYYQVMRNNIFAYCSGGAAGTGDCYHGYFYNNLTLNTGSGYLAIISQRTMSNPWTPATEGFYVFNNMFVDTRGQMPTWPYRNHSGEYSDFQHDYNNWYNNGSAIPSGGMFDPNQEPHSTFGSPSLTMSGGTPTTWQGWVNYCRPAWNAQSNAMLKDKGKAAGGTVPAVWTDIEGVSRYRDGGWDIGPYEYPGVVPAPTADFVGTPTVAPVPFTVAFTDCSTGPPTAWSWSFGDSGTSTERNPSHAYTAVGTYTVALTATNATGSDSETKTNYITGKALETNFTYTPSFGMPPFAVSFTDTTVGTPTSWAWTFGDGGTSTAQNPSHTYTSANYFTVALTATKATGSDTETKTNCITGCRGSVTIYPTTYTLGCGTFTGNLSDLQTDNSVGLTFTPRATDHKLHSEFYGATGYTRDQIAAITASTRARKLGPSTTSPHQASWYINYLIPGCPGEQAPSNLHECGWCPFSSSFTTDSNTWSGTDVASMVNDTGQVGIEFLAGNPGTNDGLDWQILLDSMKWIVYLNPNGTTQAPVADFSGTPTSGTAPLAVTFTDESLNVPTSWSWSFGDSTTSTVRNPSHTYNSAGSYTVTLTATNTAGSDGETKTSYITTTVAPPIAAFSAAPTSGTAPLAVTFTDTSVNTPTSWSWTFGDSSTSTVHNPSHTYNSVGSYTVTLTATNSGGSDGETKSNYITATPAPPVANFSATPTTGTAPLAVTFTDSSTGTPTSWSWAFGDATTSTAQSPSHTYSSTGSFTVTLTATNAGGSDGETKTNYITVSSAAPTFVAAGAVASNAAAITPALPAGLATNDILLLFLETANQAITIPTPNGGTWTQVTNSPQSTGTAGAADATRLTVFWSRYNGTQGAPTTSDSGDHQLGRMIAIRGAATSGDPCNITAGGIEATADTSGAIPGATTTVANTLVVAALATSLPDASSTAKFSAWTNANLTSLTERTDNTVTAGNGGGLALATGGKATAGAYTTTGVTLVNASTKAMMSLALKVPGGAAPVANFSGTPTSGTAPLSVTFTDSSANTPTSWSWSFGDSTTSTAQNPSHTYSSAANYTVTLTATNANGSDGETKTNYISVSAPSLVFVPVSQSFINGSLASGSPTDFEVLRTDNEQGMVYNPAAYWMRMRYYYQTGYSPAQVSNVHVELQLHSTQADTPKYMLYVRGVGDTYGPALTGWVLPGTTDTWFSGDITNGDLSSYLSDGGQFILELCACGLNYNNYQTVTDVARITLTTAGGGSPPVANFTATPTTGTAPLAVSFTDSSTNTPTSWSWAFGDSATSTVNNPSHTYASAGNYSVTLTATNAYGSDGETKSNYITVTSPLQFVPSNQVFLNGSLDSGSPTDFEVLRTDDNQGMVYNPSAFWMRMRQYFSTGYGPSQVSNIYVEYQLRSTQPDTPKYQLMLRNVGDTSDGRTIAGFITPGTTDTWFSGNVTSGEMSTYLSSGGQFILQLCACGLNYNNYQTVLDVARITLTTN